MRQPKRSHRVTYGQGSFQWIESKQTWRGRIDAGYTPDGKRRRIEVTDRDEDKAWAKFIAKKADIEAGTLTSTQVERTTVAEWATEWITERKTQVRPKTYNSDASIVRKWIIPHLGRIQLRDLTARDVRRLAKAVTDQGRTTTQAHLVQRIFQQICTAARAEGYVIPEPVFHVEKARPAISDREAIPLPQALQLLDVASKLPDGSRWVAALLQGMRQGEALGLTWEHVNLTDGVVDVSWQLQQLPYADQEKGTFRVPHGYESRHLEGSYHLVRPKSKAGYRVTPLVPWMLASLQEWQKVAPQSPYGLVWPRPDGGPRRAVADRKEWKALQAQAGVIKGTHGQFVLHEARHTTATLLLEAGVDPEVIKAILGHSSIVTSRGYMHVSQASTRSALEKVAATLRLEG